jgi:hypothetical protein
MEGTYRFDETPVPAGPVQTLLTPEDLKRIRFTDGVAAVEVPFSLLAHIRFRNDRREPSARLEALKDSIRQKGFIPFDPIIACITRKGKWSIVDGGHRLTAAREIAREFWANLFGRKVRTLYFLLFTTPRSLTGLAEKKKKAPKPETVRVLAESVPPKRVDPAAFEDEDEDTRV